MIGLISYLYIVGFMYPPGIFYGNKCIVYCIIAANNACCGFYIIYVPTVSGNRAPFMLQLAVKLIIDATGNFIALCIGYNIAKEITYYSYCCRNVKSINWSLWEAVCKLCLKSKHLFLFVIRNHLFLLCHLVFNILIWSATIQPKPHIMALRPIRGTRNMFLRRYHNFMLLRLF